MSHQGIELQVTLQNGQVIYQANSDMIAAKCGLLGWNNSEGWSDILPTAHGIRLRARAVQLPDAYPDDDEDQEDEPVDQAAEPTSADEFMTLHFSLYRDQEHLAAGDAHERAFSSRAYRGDPDSLRRAQRHAIEAFRAALQP